MRRPQKDLTILLVDDDEDDYLICRDLLREGLGPCRITWVDSYLAGVAALEAGGHDVALVDFRLGAETGLDLLETARQRDWRTPIILLTGLDDASVDRLAAESGAADYLVKQHLSSTELERAVRFALVRADLLAQARESEERFRAIVENANDAIVIADENERIIGWNPAAGAMFGYLPQDVIGARLADVLRLDADHVADDGAGSVVATRRDGALLAIEISTSSWTVGQTRHTSQIIRDVTEQTNLQRRLREQATTDALTGLANRTSFGHALESATDDANTGATPGFAALFIDLDDFKLVNDCFGHAVGDEVLRHAAARITRQLRQSDLAARLGGDEFAVLLPAVTTPSAVDDVNRRLLEELRRPYDIAGQRCHTGASIGTALHRPGRTASEILQEADVAMYAAKAKGKGQAEHYRPAQREGLMARLEFASTLRGTDLETGFEVHYQPVVELESGRPSGVEALLRWRHPGLGLVEADRFIQIAEESGLIVRLGGWVLEQALRQLRRWRDEGVVGHTFAMQVNIAGAQLSRSGLDRSVNEALAAAGIEPRALCLEITESALIDTGDLTALAAVRDLGVGIAIDDFGTGHSSLAFLAECPATTVKIDHRLIARLPADPRATTLVQGALAISDALGLTPIAEGVESAEQADLLRRLGCRQAQGFLFARPGPAHLVAEALRGLGAPGALGAKAPQPQLVGPRRPDLLP
jgi:diguanylate cyclase (GGDEF)-like protein/PAS domain S-box-containing protein